MKHLAGNLARVVADLLALPAGELEPLFEVPKEVSRGDLAFPCFRVASRRKENPAALAQRLAAAWPPDPLVKEVFATGPYLNFRFNAMNLAGEILAGILREGARYGLVAASPPDLPRGASLTTPGSAAFPASPATPGSPAPPGSRAAPGNPATAGTVVVDYGSPNVGKPLAFHHLRSTMIGASLSRIYRAAGWRVIGINHLGDWGTTFGKYLVALRRLAGGRIPATIKELMGLYVRYHEEAEKDPAWEDEAREAFARLEAGQPEERRVWEEIRSLTLRDFQKVYDLLGVSWDLVRGESAYLERMASVCAELEAKGLLKESEGAQVVDLERFGMPPCLIRKKDGSTLYATRDIAAALWRWQEFRFDRMLYVVDMGQTLHFRQLFKVLELMGHDWASRCRHVPFGLVLFEGEKTGSRKGNVVYLQEVFDQTVARAAAIIEKKNPGLADRARVAREVGIGAVVFNDLKNRRVKDVKFDWDKMLSFEGETGPYLQYTHARLASVVRKSGRTPSASADWSRLTAPEEGEVIQKLAAYPRRVRDSVAEAEPSLVSGYLLELAAACNHFYNHHQVLTDDAGLSDARLSLVEAARRVLADGLSLLFLAAPGEM